jgi:hypothetical protein
MDRSFLKFDAVSAIASNMARSTAFNLSGRFRTTWQIPLESIFVSTRCVSEVENMRAFTTGNLLDNHFDDRWERNIFDVKTDLLYLMAMMIFSNQMYVFVVLNSGLCDVFCLTSKAPKRKHLLQP